MKRILVPAITIFVLIVLLLSCKKGEDDPAFTLLTRKTRLAGDWTMISGNITIGIKDSTGAYASQIYKLTEKKYSYDVIGKGAHFEEKCKLSLSITKKGVIVIKQVMDSLNIESTGTWDFLGKVGKNKNKESISIRLTKTNNYSNRFRTFNKSTIDFTYHIKELRNKKLVLANDEELILLNRSAGVFITSEYTFVQDE